MKDRRIGLRLSVLLVLAIASSTFALKITHIHETNGLKATTLPQSATWRCKVTPPTSGTMYAGFDYMATLYGYVYSENGESKCGAAVNATTQYVFKSNPTGMGTGETCKAEAWTSDEAAPPYCPPPNGN